MGAFLQAHTYSDLKIPLVYILNKLRVLKFPPKWSQISKHKDSLEFPFNVIFVPHQLLSLVVLLDLFCLTLALGKS